MIALDLDLITGRTLNQGRGAMTGKLGGYYQRNVAVLYMNGEDLNEIGLGHKGLVRISSEFGQVVVRAAEAEEELPRGLGYMPYGPWASTLVASDTSGTGMPSMKNVHVKVEIETSEDIKPATDLVGEFLR